MTNYFLQNCHQHEQFGLALKHLMNLGGLILVLSTVTSKWC